MTEDFFLPFTAEYIGALPCHQRNEGKMPITATRNPMPSVMLAAWDFFMRKGFNVILTDIPWYMYEYRESLRGHKC